MSLRCAVWVPLLLVLVASRCAGQRYPDTVTPAHVELLHAAREPVHGQADALLVTPQDDLFPPVTEPRTSAAYSTACYGYWMQDGKYRQWLAVYVPDRTLLPIARQAARLLALIRSMAVHRFGQSCAKLWSEPVHVWLSVTGPAGGEQENNNLYIRGVLTHRTEIEWARELAHEYGHFLLPGASGYTDPESWANGVLGERLFLKWLYEDLTAGILSSGEVPYVNQAVLEDYCQKQVFPLVQRMQRDGPDPVLLAGKDRRSMDAFTGLLLYMDSTYGSRSIEEILVALPRRAQHRGTDFLIALTTWLHDASPLKSRLPASGPTMLYLPAGTFFVRPDSRSAQSLSVLGASVQPSGFGWTVRVPADAWRPVAAPSKAPVSLTWTRAA